VSSSPLQTALTQLIQSLQNVDSVLSAGGAGVDLSV